MKNVALLFLGILFYFPLSLGAQNNARVTITVDMSSETVSPEGVFVFGNFFNGWDEPLVDNEDGTWSYFASFTKGDTLYYQFKNGDTVEDIKSDNCLNMSTGQRFLVVPNQDSIVAPMVCFNHCVACDSITTSTTDFSRQLQLQIFPNPMQQETQVRWEQTEMEINYISLRTLNGQELRTYTNLDNNSVSIKRGNLSSGVYFIELVDKQGRNATYKLIVQ
jgi:hypothetical protein